MNDIAYFWFALSGIFAMISIYYFFEAIRPRPKFNPFGNLLAFQKGLIDEMENRP